MHKFNPLFSLPASEKNGCFSITLQNRCSIFLSVWGSFSAQINIKIKQIVKTNMHGEKGIKEEEAGGVLLMWSVCLCAHSSCTDISKRLIIQLDSLMRLCPLSVTSFIRWLQFLQSHTLSNWKALLPSWGLWCYYMNWETSLAVVHTTCDRRDCKNVENRNQKKVTCGFNLKFLAVALVDQ